jgi:hypothetical protein
MQPFFCIVIFRFFFVLLHWNSESPEQIWFVLVVNFREFEFLQCGCEFPNLSVKKEILYLSVYL